MKIIKITEENVLIGTDEGQVLQIKKGDLGFEPKLGMEVEKFTSDSEIIITPKEVSVQEEPKRKESDVNMEEALKKGIVVNVSNTNTTDLSNKYSDNNTYAQSGKVVNKLVYVLLAIFLGWFGLHKFYAGKASGVIYLLFFWTGIPCFISLIEGIMACFKPSDSRGNIVV